MLSGWEGGLMFGWASSWSSWPDTHYKARQSFCLTTVRAGVIGARHHTIPPIFPINVALISHPHQLKMQSVSECLWVTEASTHRPLCWGWRMSSSSCLTSLGESWYKSTAGLWPPRICSSYSMAWMIHLNKDKGLFTRDHLLLLSTAPFTALTHPERKEAKVI